MDCEEYLTSLLMKFTSETLTYVVAISVISVTLMNTKMETISMRLRKRKLE